MWFQLTDSLTGECLNERIHFREKRGEIPPDGVRRGGVWDSRSQGAARRGQHLAQVDDSLAFKPIERQVDDVQARVLPQQLAQVNGTFAAHAVTARSQHRRHITGTSLQGERWPLMTSFTIITTLVEDSCEWLA